MSDAGFPQIHIPKYPINHTTHCGNMVNDYCNECRLEAEIARLKEKLNESRI